MSDPAFKPVLPLLASRLKTVGRCLEEGAYRRIHFWLIVVLMGFGSSAVCWKSVWLILIKFLKIKPRAENREQRIWGFLAVSKFHSLWSVCAPMLFLLHSVIVRVGRKYRFRWLLRIFSWYALFCQTKRTQSSQNICKQTVLLPG